MLPVEWCTNALKATFKQAFECIEQVFECIGGIVDSIAASQAVDPGSIPGQCSRVSCVLQNQQWRGHCYTVPPAGHQLSLQLFKRDGTGTNIKLSIGSAVSRLQELAKLALVV